MNGWLLDTNVLSELRKPLCDARVKSWSEQHPTTSLFVSRITLAEIRHGIVRVIKDKQFRAELEIWLEHSLRPWFADRVLEIDEDVVLTWLAMVEDGKTKRYTFSQPDLFIAATASVHDLCVVTRNTRDFEVANVPVLNPWLEGQPRKGL